MSIAFERREVFYQGNVQGVGFRYTTDRIARRYAVTGYVRNLADGRVEVVAEGWSEELDRFLDDIGQALSRHIERRHVQTVPARDEFPDFSIRQ